MISKLFYSLSAYAGEGTGHSHGSPPLDTTQMIVIGVIVLIACAAMIFFGRKK